MIEGAVANAGVADSVKNILTAGGKTYNGSEAVEITAADLGAITEIPQAAEDTLGGVKLGYTDDGNNRGVKVDATGKAYVEVPAAIVYTASNGLNKVGNDFQVAKGGILTAMIGDGQVTDEKIAAVNVSKLIQTEGDELILDGGKA